ncbi:OLC1v1026463C1 [Oldenlandia corymbosa var. corymbosa]|uniref:OLC1v1026463C1 n=1 Tax=Oldenlandia corymbosa var. corymbosa TaxID=529605 RepID=A0AAV1C756_OLDCO|nr:OLC1v1026463C1 [Oldenlandia corymbosa var. corymbosa]
MIMSTNNRSHTLFGLQLVILVLILQLTSSSGWFFSSNKESSNKNNNKNTNGEETRMFRKDSRAEFSIESFNDQRGIKHVEEARDKMIAPSSEGSCWQNAYGGLLAGCSNVFVEEETRNRFAWHLTDCFLRYAGRPSLPKCDLKSPVKKCLEAVDRDSSNVYLEFHLQANSICHQLQIPAFRHQTERLVNELKKTAEYAEEKLDSIEAQAEQLLRNSKHVDEYLSSIDVRAQQLEETSKNVESHVLEVFGYSKEVYEQSKAISASQLELAQSQVRMKESLAEGMALVKDSYTNLGQEITSLRDEAVEIEKEVSRVGNAMFSKMDTLQSKADNIGNMAESSLEKQKELLDRQSAALDGVHHLAEFSSMALEESRGILQKLTDIGNKQQEELLEKQEQLKEAHDQLVENSKAISAAQEAFESRQATMFLALEKLFDLHNRMFLASRMYKAFALYTLVFFLLYMLTSTRQTYNVRHVVYIGLFVTMVIELCIIWWTTYDTDKQEWVISILRSVSGILLMMQLGYSVCTYRDFEVLNHKMLLTLMGKVSCMQNNKHYSSDVEDEEDDDDVDWSRWVDTDLPEDVGLLEDPDYLSLQEEIAENSATSSSATRKYNLRNRH